MRIIRLALAWYFAFLAFLYISIWLLALWALVHPHTRDGTFSTVHKAMLVGLPLGLGILFGLAWWTVLKTHAVARNWAFAASLADTVLCASSLFRDPAHYEFPSIGLAIGVAGLIAFSLRLKDPQQLVRTAAPPILEAPIPGDGTSELLNNLVLVAGIVSGPLALRFWLDWSDSHRLAFYHGPVFFVGLWLDVILVFVIREAGHAIAGIVLHMKLSGFQVGPLQWWYSNGNLKFTFRRDLLFPFTGSSSLVPTSMDKFRLRKIMQLAAGPVANIATGLLAMAAALMAPGRSWETAWSSLACFGTLSLVFGTLNLAPFRRSEYSDGAKIYQILSHGIWSDYHKLVGMMASTMLSPLRPRDADASIIRDIGETLARGREKLRMYVFEYLCCIDKNQLDEAARAVEKANLLCEESGMIPPHQWYGMFIFGNAFLRRDAATARLWWERLQVLRSNDAREGQWISLSALLFSENRVEEAAEAWKRAAEWTRQWPNVGYWESERDALKLLREAIDPTGFRISENVPVQE